MNTTNIYNEMETLTPNMIGQDAYREIAMNVAARQKYNTNYTLLTKKQKETLEFPKDKIRAISTKSALFDTLLDWYGNLENLLKCVKSGYLYGDHIYFVNWA